MEIAKKNIALVLVSPFADWEYGLFAASAREWFGASVTAFSPDGKDVQSIAGLTVTKLNPVNDIKPDDFDAIVLIGSDGWRTKKNLVPAGLLTQFNDAGKIVGAICGATIAPAREGLFKNRKHTSNGADWLKEAAGDYDGAENYQDVACAVRDENLVTAPGSAPATFALALLEALYPDQPDQLTQMRNMFAREHSERAK